MKFFKNLNLPLVAIVFAASLVAAVVFTVSRQTTKSSDILVATTRLENRRLPASALGQINEEKFLLVYLTSRCGACSDELDLLSELKASSPGLKIFGIMGEEESVVKNYIMDNDINFPIISDRNLDVLRNLRLEFFPTNLAIKNGLIEKAYLGPPEKGELLALISD